MADPRRQISPERQMAYYAGFVISGLGLLLFVSNFFLGPSVQDQVNFESGMKGVAARALIGMALMVVGVVVTNLGRSGAAGSGVVLDPEKARKDLEPWNRARGGMLSDTLEEAAPVIRDIVQNPGAGGGTVVKVRCPHCRELNDEDAKFCKACGKGI